MIQISVGGANGFRHTLSAFGVPVELYGQKGVKRLEDLLREVDGKDCALVVNDVGVIERHVDVVRVAVTYGSLRLIEEKQVFRDGRGERRRMFPFVSEKMHIDEDPRKVFVRALKEELGITISSSQASSEGIKEERKESGSYPGLSTCYRFHDFCLELTDGQYRKEGYKEEQDDKTTHFAWVPKKDLS